MQHPGSWIDRVTGALLVLLAFAFVGAPAAAGPLDLPPLPAGLSWPAYLPPGSMASADSARLKGAVSLVASATAPTESQGPGEVEPGAGPRYVCAEDLDEFVRSAAILGGGTAWDLYWTAYALNRSPNAREANPLGFNPEARMSLKLAMGSGAALLDWKLRRAGHRRLANVARWTALSIQFAAGVNNIVVAAKGR